MKVLAIIMAGAVAYGAAYPPLELHALAWLAPVIWLALLRGAATARQRFWYMFLVGYLGSVLVVHWLTALFSTLAVFLWAVPATYFGIWGVIAGMFGLPGKRCVEEGPSSANSPTWLRLSWPAVSWVGMEYFRCELAPLAFSFGGLGYSQPTMGGFFLASGIGVYGISFLMVLLASLVLEAWSLTATRPIRVGAVTMFAAVSVVSFVDPVANASRGEQPVGRALLQQLTQDNDIGARDSLEPRGGSGRLDLIVWPELTYTNDPRLPESKWFLDMMQAEASQTSWGAIFGAVDHSPAENGPPGSYYNSAFLLGPDGQIQDRAAKNQPVQLMSDGMPAPDVVVMEMPGTQPGQDAVRAGVGVCYDGCFQRFSRRMVSRGADFLVFPTMNLESWGKVQHRQHQRMFQMRAAETGRTVLVAAVSGPTFAAAPGGAVGSAVAELQRTDAITADILPPQQTLFNLGGWVTGPAFTLLTVLGAAWGAGARFRERGREGEKVRK
jgi:apolipoprotein N-acyltransferase